VQGAGIYLRLSAPLRNGQSFTLKFKKVIAARIVCLLCARGPLAVSIPSLFDTLRAMPTRIMTFDINSIYAVFRTWTRTYICVEVHKRKLPVGADRDAASTIIGVGRIALERTAIKHRSPYPVFWCAPHAMSLAILARGFLLQTSATLSATIFQTTTKDNMMALALAKAQPQYGSILVYTNIAKHSQTTKDVARQILSSFAWNWDNLWGIIAHSKSPYKTCSSQGRPRIAAWYLCVLYSSIIAQLCGFWRVNSLTVGGTE
jgi:hypothetical protein